MPRLPFTTPGPVGSRLALALALGLIAASCSEPAPLPPEPVWEPPKAEPEPEPPPPLKFDVGTMPEPPVDSGLADVLRGRLVEPVLDGPALMSSDATRAFYAQRDHQPAWIAQGRLNAAALDTLQALARLPEHGLDPARYGVNELTALGSEPDDPVAFELRLTDTWLTVGDHLLRGRVDPVKIHPAWSVTSRTADLVTALEGALEDASAGASLLGLAPSHPEYAQLQAALAELRKQHAAGPWPLLKGATLPLGPGATGPAVATLRARLARTDELADPAGDTYDPALVEAVRRFQRRHGIEATGVVDAATKKALDVTIDARIAQLEANLERWRWLPDDLGATHVRVNIAAFEVVLVKEGVHALTMKAVVGKRYRKTPVFSTTIEQVTINPRWGVPPKLAVQDLLPEIKRDITTLERKRLRVIDARTGVRVDPSSVPWSKLSATRFPYILQQEPGPDNSLGRYKLVMPNPYDVYLHDTPKRHLFAEDQRAFSSGCVRLQHPRDLAVALLEGHPKWNGTKLDSAVTDGKELTIRLPKPVPVHLLYWTAFVDAEGRLQLRQDLYARDVALLAALAEDADRTSGQ